MTPSLLNTMLTIAAGVVMLRMGLRRNLLRVRRERRCAFCSRRIDTPYCPHCTR